MLSRVCSCCFVVHGILVRAVPSLLSWLDGALLLPLVDWPFMSCTSRDNSCTFLCIATRYFKAWRSNSSTKGSTERAYKAHDLDLDISYLKPHTMSWVFVRSRAECLRRTQYSVLLCLKKDATSRKCHATSKSLSQLTIAVESSRTNC